MDNNGLPWPSRSLRGRGAGARWGLSWAPVALFVHGRPPRLRSVNPWVLPPTHRSDRIRASKPSAWKGRAGQADGSLCLMEVPAGSFTVWNQGAEIGGVGRWCPRCYRDALEILLHQQISPCNFKGICFLPGKKDAGLPAEFVSGHWAILYSNTASHRGPGQKSFSI